MTNCLLVYFSPFQVYNADWQVPDSAASATAILCGIKAPFSTIGVDDGAVQYYCPSQPGHEVKSITYWAQDAGKTRTCSSHLRPLSQIIGYIMLNFITIV